MAKIHDSKLETEERNVRDKDKEKEWCSEEFVLRIITTKSQN